MNQVLDFIKNNKKMVIILAVVLVVVLVLLLLGGRGSSNSGFFSAVETIKNEEQYNGTIDMNISGKDIHFDLIKNGKNYVVSVSIPGSEITMNDLLVKQDGVTYLNTGSYASNGGLIALRDAKIEEKEKIYLSDALLSALSELEITTTQDENGISISVDSTESWAGVFTAVQTVLNDNVDTISGNYQEKEAMKAWLNELIKYAKKAAETDTVANAINISMTNESENDTRKYKGNFDFTADFSTLPDFINPDYFDSNQLKITGTFNIVTGPASTARPTGAVYDANAQNLPSFLSTIWNTIFDKATYVPFNEVTITSNSVTNKYDLGETIEESSFLFGENGITSAMWTITSYNKDIVECYRKTYDTNAEVVEYKDDGLYRLVLSASEEALASLNKIGTTPNQFGEYLKTAKGGDIIV